MRKWSSNYKFFPGAPQQMSTSTGFHECLVKSSHAFDRKDTGTLHLALEQEGGLNNN